MGVVIPMLRAVLTTFPTPTRSPSATADTTANTFTVFNLILAVFGVATLVFGNPKDALFLGILVVGFIYEWKKGALEWE